MAIVVCLLFALHHMGGAPCLCTQSLDKGGVEDVIALHRLFVCVECRICLHALVGERTYHRIKK